MKIIFLPEVVAFGGEERNLLGLSRWLWEHGVSHAIYCYYDRIGLARYADWPLEVRELRPVATGIHKAIALARLVQRVAREKEKILLVGIQAAYHVGLCPWKGYLLRISDTPGVIEQGLKEAGIKVKPTPAFRLRTWMVDRLARRGATRADAVIATTDRMAREMREIWGVEPLVVRAGGKSRRDSLSSELSGGRPRSHSLNFLSISRLERNKRIAWILDTMWLLKKEGFFSPGGFVVHVAGEGSCRGELEALAHTLELGKEVLFHGPVDDSAIEKLYESADIFLMPAQQGYGLPALEALERGLPVVLHADSGVAEILSDTPWAYVVHGGIENFVEGVRTMVLRIKCGLLQSVPLPHLPTEEQWAETICRTAGWV
jgi:glycosyltransferase involved in cell wall biosynthesis